MTIQTAHIGQLTMQVQIAAPPHKVWQALTENIGQWWPAEFYAGGAAGERNFSLETFPGGRMLEQWDGGGGVLWGTVVCIDPNVRLQVLGTTFPNWGGPSQWYGSWDLTKTDQGTELVFSESALGRVSQDGLAEKDKGWKFLWLTLKAHTEGTPPPAWAD